MQVSQIAELDTHAVIGGGQAQAFGMSDSAEFFTVLSDTLYRDKMRAVIREVVCNAWDAHIMVNKTDVPVEITLNAKELVIKDFGPGIAKDKIGPVYCVYGASTKVKDGKQTGGFGLGCKAPFSYSDHFTVTSSIDGFRTLWAISRGGAATEGKPDFRPMVSVPSKETGITVSIPIKDENDVGKFTALIREIVNYGGMLATLNGEPLERLDYTEARKTGFGIVFRNRHSATLAESRAYVLYGTVLYPIVTTDKEIMTKVGRLDNLIDRSSRIILIAEPNTIGVQPSREGLSYSELTTATLHAKLDEATRRLKNIDPGLARNIFRAHVRSRIKTPDHFNTYMPEGTSGAFVGLIADPKLIAERGVSEKLSNYLTPRDCSSILHKELAKKFPQHRRFYRRARHHARRENVAKHHHYSHTMPLRLAAHTGTLRNMVIFSRESSYKRWLGKPIDEASNSSVLEPRIIIAPNRKSVNTLLGKEYEALGDSGHREVMRNHGFVAIILNNPKESLLEEIQTLAARLKLKTTLLEFPKRKKGEKVGDAFVGIADLYSNGHSGWRASKSSITKPIAYWRVKGTQESLTLPYTHFSENRDQLLGIAKLFPDLAVVWTAKQEAKLKTMKVPSIEDVIAREIETLSDRRDVQYVLMTANMEFAANSNYRSIGYFINRAASESLKVAKFFFPDRVKITDQAERMRKVLDFADKVDRYTVSGAVNKARTNMLAKARKTFKHLIITEKEAEKKFTYLAPFMNLNISHKNEDVLLETFRFLARRHAAQAAKPAKPTINPDMKEAA